jgi:hypothetical protein
MTFWTYTLSSGTLSIDSIDYAYFVSIQANSTTGACTVLGGIPFKGINSNTVNISAGEGINLSALSTASPLSGITITWVAGTVDIVVGF